MVLAVDSRNRWPLIRLVKYQISPRFSKPIAHPLAHPAIQRLTIEPDDPTTPYERNLTTAHAVVERMSAHAQVLRGRVDVKPARLDDRSRSNVSRFHGGTPRELPRVLSGGAERLPPGAETTGIVGAALGFSGSVDGSGQGPELTSVSSLSGMVMVEWRLTAARKHAVGGARALLRAVRRGDEAMGEDLMLTPVSRRRQRHRHMASHGNSRQELPGSFWERRPDDATLACERVACESLPSATSTVSCRRYRRAIC